MQRGRLLSPAQEALLTRAIAEAEAGNRGEVRVHIEDYCEGDALERAAELFAELDMNETAEDTGVLLYIATQSRGCAVFAGSGIHGARDPAFWQEVAEAVASGYRRNAPIAGIEMALLEIGQVLRERVPGEDSAGDELPNVVTTGSRR